MSWQDMADRVVERVVATFTTAATYTPMAGSPYPIDCVFDAAYVEAVVLDGAEVQSVYPRALVRFADLEAKPVAGDRMTINDTLYRVAEHRPDGEAGSLLILNKL